MATFKELLIRIVQEILNPLITLVFLLAVAAFGWGMVMYLMAQGSDDKVQKSKKIMWFGIIGMFVLVSMWGSVFLLCNFFGTCLRTGFSFPGIPGGGGGSSPGSYFFDSNGEMMIDQGNGDGIIAPGNIDCSVDIRQMTNAQCTYCYGASSCVTTLTPTQQTACLNSPSVCEPCLHFLDEGNPRAYVKCVKDKFGF